MNPEKDQEALLILTQDDQAKGHWILAQDVTTIGRWEDNDVVIPDRWISRHHAEIRRQGSRYVIHDLGSKNGLFVNGKRIAEPLPLEDGDHIQIAPRCQLTFVDSEATAPLFEGQNSVQIDTSACRVWVKGQELVPALSSAQFALLQVMAREPGRVFSRQELIPAVWPDQDPSGISREALNSLVRRLRKRLRSIDPSHRYIFAVRGHGFKFEHP